MSEGLPPKTCRWVAAVIVDSLSSVDRCKRFGPSTRDQALGTLVTQLTVGGRAGLQKLLLKDLKCVWKELQERPFVRQNNDKGLPARKDDAVALILGFLMRPEAAVELSSAALQQPTGTPTANSTSITAAAALPAVATTGIPAVAQPLHYQQYAQYPPYFNPGAVPLYNPHAAASVSCTAQAARVPAASQKTEPIRIDVDGIVITACNNNNNSNSASSKKRRRGEIGGASTPSLVSVAANVAASASAPTLPGTISTSSTTTSTAAIRPDNADQLRAHLQVMVSQMAAASATIGLERSNPDTAPQTATEQRLFPELQQMGFDDNGEILAAIRRAVKACPGADPSADQIMIDLVTQREENEEARKMDEARLLSEKQQQQDEKRSRAIQESTWEERLLHATLRDWVDPAQEKDMFPESWLLQHQPVNDLLADLINNVGTSDKPSADDKLTESRLASKKQLMDFLKLEKLARKWYRNVPAGFFTNVVGVRLLATSRPFAIGDKWRYVAVAKELKAMSAEIENGMYRLENLEKGVPRLFANAQLHDEDDDDDVILIG